MLVKEMLEKLGFKNLSPIQESVIQNFDKPGHIVGLAPTGTGKTHAYLLPLLEKLNRESEFTQAVILLPTNELVLQVDKMLAETDDTVSYKSYYGSVDMEKEAGKLKRNQPSIVITTPAKLIDIVVNRNALNLKHIKYFILDEADMMFDEDFLGLIDPVVANLEVDKFLLMSATITKQMAPFIQKYFGTHQLFDTTKDTKLNITYPMIPVSGTRLNTLFHIMKAINPYLGIIFVSKNEDIEAVYNFVLEQGYSAISYSSTVGVKQRKKILEDIHNLKYQYVVSSDLLSRGIDFKASHIIHYDLPYKLEFFKHRSGRTGRMGDEGVVITIFDENDQRKMDKLRVQGIPFEPYTISKGELKPIEKKSKTYDKKIANAIKKIPKPKKVAPNYKKKHEEKVKAAIKKVKKARYRNASFRKSRSA
ncbi:DEAD/DEAH box helicase [Acholeplasma equirhinis]|uniref:DEAD/DEAH box helicase n=1 Tax=Acholeplasma equirhinis TaxID=555393 RepID=UPI00197AC1F3|nr:DEAD/DEAH box helicase [Acholeplasma equirhinis]MBN3490215.1 DEAD/DEAH box helicase [Acholeplasma equirhinis]